MDGWRWFDRPGGLRTSHVDQERKNQYVISMALAYLASRVALVLFFFHRSCFRSQCLGRLMPGLAALKQNQQHLP